MGKVFTLLQLESSIIFVFRDLFYNRLFALGLQRVIAPLTAQPYGSERGTVCALVFPRVCFSFRVCVLSFRACALLLFGCALFFFLALYPLAWMDCPFLFALFFFACRKNAISFRRGWVGESLAADLSMV